MIIKLDGPYTHKSGFSGPIGKLFEKVSDIPVNFGLKALQEENIAELPEDIVRKLSTTQKN